MHKKNIDLGADFLGVYISFFSFYKSKFCLVIN